MNSRFKKINPLSAPQEETAGSETQQKYLFQYYWAIAKCLEEYDNKNTFAIVVESHEDVVYISSINLNETIFELFQLKTKKLSLNSIVKASKNKKNSILGKLVLTFIKLITHSKENKLNITIGKLSLVHTHPIQDFSKQKNINDPNILEFNLNNINQANKKIIKDSILNELNNVPRNEIPRQLSFIRSTFNELNLEEILTGKISTFCSKYYSNHYVKPHLICTTLINELLKKGTDKYTYSDWDEFIRKKSLTKNEISSTIKIFSVDQRINSTQDNKKALEDLMIEIDIPILRRPKVRSSYNIYETEDSDTSISFQSRKEAIQDEINKIYPLYNNDAKSLYYTLQNNIKSRQEIIFSSEIDSIGGLLYEIIRYSLQ